MVKLALIGHGKNPENVIDIVKKSLSVRNKHAVFMGYKELMSQCNSLGMSITVKHDSQDYEFNGCTGYPQLVDFRFGKKLTGERTCGIADSLAPEMVLGKGHGFASDWWALGVLIYFMLQAEMPFGSWRESELDTFAKIAKGQLTLPYIQY